MDSVPKHHSPSPRRINPFLKDDAAFMAAHAFEFAAVKHQAMACGASLCGLSMVRNIVKRSGYSSSAPPFSPMAVATVLVVTLSRGIFRSLVNTPWTESATPEAASSVDPAASQHMVEAVLWGAGHPGIAHETVS